MQEERKTLQNNWMNGSGETGSRGLANRRLQPLGHVSGAEIPMRSNASGQLLTTQQSQNVRTKAVRVGTSVGTGACPKNNSALPHFVP